MKVPAVPPTTFTIESKHLRTFSEPLWRVYRTTGPHALGWNELRHYGPVPGMRFDPHPEPAGEHDDVGVLYAATDVVTALGEVYQSTRVIARAEGGATLVSWEPTRPLTLLDLTTNWPIVNGAAASMMMTDEKSHTQAWAAAIEQRHGADIDGLFHQSSMTDKAMVTLFTRTERDSAFPARPRFHAPLASPAADVIVLVASNELHYGVL